MSHEYIFDLYASKFQIIQQYSNNAKRVWDDQWLCVSKTPDESIRWEKWNGEVGETNKGVYDGCQIIINSQGRKKMNRKNSCCYNYRKSKNEKFLNKLEI